VLPLEQPASVIELKKIAERTEAIRKPSYGYSRAMAGSVQEAIG
jgi:hypothetical protein